ncbi:DUF1223 domain-containing protein [Labrys okinawensis]|uniref:DUF1223 domain-containing protein n=1 Tax=Labrys okinawensis TaxID=346911 RepID=A0A2S9Q437_9HYPH|nr:DUF1223 domain-containing protein [Labrys okinawensis]PRH84112.1 DUF1223 domain-containing protein [Labrys okinawensis]
MRRSTKRPCFGALRLALPALGLIVPLLGGAAPVEARPLTVVELFTSQGCSSCPPANANLAAISRRPGVLALSFSVTYWDRLGWKDVFARPDYTQRQVTYERPLGQSGPFTPQMVVNGRASLVGNDLAEVDAAIAGAGVPDAAPSLTVSSGHVAIGRQASPRSGLDIWLVRYDPRQVEVPVRAGENAGRTLPHKNVVHDLVRLGRWKGEALDLPIAPAPAGLRTAILLQAPDGGPIQAAATD